MWLNESINIDDCCNKLHIYRLRIKGPHILLSYKECLSMIITGSGENDNAVHGGSEIEGLKGA